MTDVRYVFTQYQTKLNDRSKTGLYLNLPGCLKTSDKLAAEFMDASSSKAKAKIIEKAEKAAKDIKDEEDSKKAQKYIKIMKNIESKGEEFISSEQSRVKNLMAERMSHEKRHDLSKALNMLKSFIKGNKAFKDEL